MDLRKVYLFRTRFEDSGTFGLVQYGSNFCRSLELPWRGNIRTLSCIPVGDYECRLIRSPKFGSVYGLINVPGRTGILIHSANFGGDRLLGYDTHLQGCIALYERDGALRNSHGIMQPAGLISRPAVSKFMQWADRKPFVLRLM